MNVETERPSQLPATFSLADVVPERAELGNGCVYVIEFSTGRVKIGQSDKPAKRVRSHVDIAEFHQQSATRVWLSPSHEMPGTTERALLAFARRMGTQVAGREYFDGVDFDFVVMHGCRFLGLTTRSIYRLVRPLVAETASTVADPFAELRKHLLFAATGPTPSRRSLELLDCDLRELYTRDEVVAALEAAGHTSTAA